MKMSVTSGFVGLAYKIYCSAYSRVTVDAARATRTSSAGVEAVDESLEILVGRVLILVADKMFTNQVLELLLLL